MPTRTRYTGMQTFASAVSTSTRVSWYLVSTTDISRKWARGQRPGTRSSSQIIIEGDIPDVEIDEENVQVRAIRIHL